MKSQLLQFWWVLAFAIVAFGAYEQASHTVVKAIHKLEAKVTDLEAAISTTEKKQEMFQLQAASLSDPAWIELSLMKGLGLVPEGYTKIYFEKEPE